MDYKFATRMDGIKASAIREILKYTVDPTVISFAAGNPAPEAFPVKMIEQITAEIMAENPIGALQYSISEGYTPLRDKLKDQVKTRYDIGEDFDDLIITSGAQQAIELACKVMCSKGDTLICENPSFIGSLNAFKSYEVNLVGVDMESDGINIQKLEEAIKQNPNTKVLYLIPNFQNPSGTTMSLQKRQAAYEICKKYGVVIIEDNPYGELRFAGQDIKNIKSFDKEGIVIYCGSFSKVLAPGLRVGFMCAPKEIISKVVVVKQVSDVHTNIISQLICDGFLERVEFDTHINELRSIYKNKCGLMLETIKAHLNPKVTFTQPEGGLFLWGTLPENVNMMEFCKRAVENKVAVVPGSAFLPSEDYKTQSFRLNYSTPTDEQIIKGIEILGELSYEII
ncbi:MAG: PLP-dependent aminotransferase family protein [Oscillospiraceae bacterium]